MFRLETIVNKVVELLPVWLLAVGLTVAALLVMVESWMARQKRRERSTATDVPAPDEVFPAMEETIAVAVTDEGEGLEEGAGPDLTGPAGHQEGPRPDPVAGERRAPRSAPGPRGPRGPAAP